MHSKRHLMPVVKNQWPKSAAITRPSERAIFSKISAKCSHFPWSSRQIKSASDKPTQLSKKPLSWLKIVSLWHFKTRRLPPWCKSWTKLKASFLPSLKVIKLHWWAPKRDHNQALCTIREQSTPTSNQHDVHVPCAPLNDIKWFY